MNIINNCRYSSDECTQLASIQIFHRCSGPLKWFFSLYIYIFIYLSDWKSCAWFEFVHILFASRNRTFFFSSFRNFYIFRFFRQTENFLLSRPWQTTKAFFPWSEKIWKFQSSRVPLWVSLWFQTKKMKKRPRIHRPRIPELLDESVFVIVMFVF